MHQSVALVFMMLASAWLLVLRPHDCVAGPSLSAQIRENLRTRIETAGTPLRISIGQERVHSSSVLPRFYENRMYQPAWSDDHGPLQQTESLIKAIRAADHEGLNPSDYHLEEIERILTEVLREAGSRSGLYPPRLADLDLLLTDAFLIYGSHLLAGSVNPETFDPEWYADRREVDLGSVLHTAVESDRIADALKGLWPAHSDYLRLREALTRYRDIVGWGGWPIVATGSKLQKGDRGERVIALRKRLFASGDLQGELSNSDELFDDELETAVRVFQYRHGLDVDGVVGRATLAALNVPAEIRVRQIELNMERWRWLPQDLGSPHILVNIANFKLCVVDDGLPIISMRVVVGREYRRTPVLSDRMTYLVLSPYWHIPHNVAVQDILPRIREDSDYLEVQRIRVFEGWGVEAKEVDPKTVDWSRMDPSTFRYRLRQDPGPWNALGRVKFMFPNKFNVYFHDTPSQELFAKTKRSFSSGCIRIERPIELAEYLLRGDPQWTREKLLAAIKTGAEQTVRLPEPIPVHLLYWTAWADEDGSIHFRDDIYGRDRRLDLALGEAVPEP